MNIVEIENLSKKYLIGNERQNPFASLKEIVTSRAREWIKKFTFRQSPSSEFFEEFWALKDLTVNIKEGDRIAILGRNGAGKSTLLKLISRITEPSCGRIKIRGRVSSLLEVGTGFHPDLTGRENIFLNGAIMGMSYREMKRKFDEIVAFADIEKFLDTPIKRYSSGMFMRLGFAVAAHLDSDLLIVDEVLAVGDAQYQEKCLKKMNEMGVKGSTVLFVSHSINSVLSLCNKGILLERGELRAYGSIEDCVSLYMRSCPCAGLHWQGNAGDENVRMYHAVLRSPGSDMDFFYHGEKTYLEVDFEVFQPHPNLNLGFSILNSRNQTIARSRLYDHACHRAVIAAPGRYQLSFHMDLDLFHPGEYQIKLECSLLNIKKILQDEVMLRFGVYSQNKDLKYELGVEKDGISLGNQWEIARK